MHTVAIKDIFEFVRNGLSIKQSDTASGFPITRIETIWNSSIDVNRFGYADIEDIEKYGGYLLECGDILMTHINSLKHLGKCAIYEGTPKQLIHGMNLLNLRPNRKISLPKYLHFYLNSGYFKNQVQKISNQSVNQASFSSGNLKKLKIPLPPLPEQQKIASILDAADNLRQKDQQLIEKYTALSQSLFLEMFGDPEINLMDWEKLKLSELTSFENGDRSSNYPSGNDIKSKGILFLSTKNISNDTLNLNVTQYISEDKFSSLSRGKAKKGDLLITLRGTLGSCCIFNSSYETAFINAQIMIIRANQQISSVYLHSLITNKQFNRMLQAIGRGAAVPQLTASQLSNLKIPLPSIELQNQFAERIQSIEAQKQLALASLEKSEALFNSLLQRAFKGELTV